VQIIDLYVVFAVATALVQVTFNAEDIWFRREKLKSYLNNFTFQETMRYREGCDIMICTILV
jgi:hypothetical protein